MAAPKSPATTAAPATVAAVVTGDATYTTFLGAGAGGGGTGTGLWLMQYAQLAWCPW